MGQVTCGRCGAIYNPMWVHECEAVYIQRGADGTIHVLGPVPLAEQTALDSAPAHTDTDKFRCFEPHGELWH